MRKPHGLSLRADDPHLRHQTRSVRRRGTSGRWWEAEVYRERDTRLNRDVAVKVLPVAFARNPERTQVGTEQKSELEIDGASGAKFSPDGHWLAYSPHTRCWPVTASKRREV